MTNSSRFSSSLLTTHRLIHAQKHMGLSLVPFGYSRPSVVWHFSASVPTMPFQGGVPCWITPPPRSSPPPTHRMHHLIFMALSINLRPLPRDCCMPISFSDSGVVQVYTASFRDEFPTIQNKVSPTPLAPSSFYHGLLIVIVAFNTKWKNLINVFIICLPPPFLNCEL